MKQLTSLWSLKSTRGVADVRVTARIVPLTLNDAPTEARHALASGPVWPTWLILTYLLHTWGELLLSPVGLSSVTRLAPRRLVGQAMGIWFLGTSLGNLIAGLFAGTIGGDAAATMPARFFQVVLTAGGTGLLLLVATPFLRRLTSDAK